MIMSDLMNSRTGMVVRRLVCLVENKNSLQSHARWKRLPGFGDTLESICNIFKNVPQLFLGLFYQKHFF